MAERKKSETTAREEETRSGEEDEDVPRGKRKKRKLCTDLSEIPPRLL